MEQKVWLITGGSQGLGACLVKKLLVQGEKVVSTTRDKQKLIRAIGEETEQFLPLELDLGKEESIAEGKRQILEKFGTIDVLVNNAGYAFRGMVEEISDEEARKNFEANVFGPLTMIRNFAGILREKRSGWIINISSVAGYRAGPWSGIYGATKYAIEGITEALQAEMAPFGVEVLSVKPGDMRTGFHDPKRLQEAANKIEDYKTMRDQMYGAITGKNGHQVSSPEKIAERLIELTRTGENPGSLFIGSDSLRIAKEKTASVQAALERYESLSLSVGHEESI